MKYLLLAAVAAGAIFLGVGWTPTAEATLSCTNTQTSKTIERNTYCVPNACGSMTFDHVRIGTAGNDVIRITGSGRWFIDAGAGNDFIGIQAFNGPNCIVGGAGMDLISAGPFNRDVCVLNNGLSNTPDAGTGNEPGGDWQQGCKTATPSPFPGSE